MQSTETTSSPSIPIVDLTEFIEHRTANPELISRIDEICRTIGFFIITGHGVDQHMQDDMMKVSKEFFHLPLDSKREIVGSKDYPYGYNGIHDEVLSRGYEKSPALALADVKESFSIGPAHEGPIRWPREPASMSSIWLKYYQACEHLSHHLYHLFAMALDLSEDWFDAKIDQHRSALRALYYPSLTAPLACNQYRSSAHTDYGAFTILKQDSVGGLQVQNRGDGRWIDVPFVPQSFVINLGDLMSRWTNDRWVSTLHRVIDLSQRETSGLSASRQSIAFFCQINPEEMVTCIPTCLSADQREKYPPIKSWDLVMEKYLASTGKK
jgi:isopenicillin N synthase-like dioxygenase